MHARMCMYIQDIKVKGGSESRGRAINVGKEKTGSGNLCYMKAEGELWRRGSGAATEGRKEGSGEGGK